MSRFLLPRRTRQIPPGWSRRQFLRSMFFSAGAVGSSSWLAACSSQLPAEVLQDLTPLIPVPPPAPGTPPATPAPTPRFANLGPLRAADANGVRTPAGFSTRVVAINNELPQRNGMSVSGPSSPATAVGTRPWHILNDGGAVIARPNGGWIYVSNSEIPGSGSAAQADPRLSVLGSQLETFTPGLGGVGTLVFDPDGTIVDSYSILTGTTFNCAGVITPWNTWLSCEEIPTGLVWECNPFAASAGIARPALGLFDHEAIAIDPVRKILWQTEDRRDGRFFRFVPSATDWPAGAARPALQAGKLQTMVVGGAGVAGAEDAPQPVTWKDTLNPAAAQDQNRDPATAVFNGGEGIWLFNDVVYFTTKNDNTIWAYDLLAETIEVIYRFDTVKGDEAANNILSGVDNLIITPQGDILVAEDGGDLQVVVLLPDGTQKPLLQIVGQDQSEVAGISFTPDGKRMYFTSDRGGRNGPAYGNGAGMLYELMLPDTI